MSASEPTTEHGKRMRAEVSEKRWRRIVAEARERGAVVDAVVALHSEGELSWRQAVARAAPELPWPTFVHHKRHYDARPGPTWERLLDGRAPPDTSLPKEMEIAARLLRQLKPDIGVDEAREHLVKQFGQDTGRVSDSWLKRVWREAGLNRPGGVSSGRQQEVETASFHGGAGLALLAAAEAELGTTLALAEAALEAGKRRASAHEPGEVVDDRADRDEKGHFTAAYNTRRRSDTATGEPDDRWATDEAKARHRDLRALPTLRSRPQTVADKLLAMGATPLLTERRGFDGLDGPAGEWLGALGGPAYMPATLDKALAEPGLLDVGDDLWQAHAARWSELTGRWREPGAPDWLQSVVYVDGTADPYWTRAFAASGKVSRIGRVMPCLARVAVHSGEGVPLLVETHAGAVSLKKRLLPLLEKLDAAVGPGADVGRLTLVDAELGSAGAIWAMHSQTEMLFVTVLKGAVLKGAIVGQEGPWQPFRQRDEVRDVELWLRGKGAPDEGIRIRGVQMRRRDGRRPQTTLFATNAGADDLPAADVARWYLGRWPRQEQLFATGRDGGGLNRSHGYGGEHVTHVALEGKRGRAQRSLQRASARRERAEQTREELSKALADAPASARKQALTLADRAVRDRSKEQQRSEQAKARVDTLPDDIYVRDTGRDSIMTCLKLNVLSLVELVLQEYFGGVSMHWRTFIEQFVALPVQVRDHGSRRVHVIRSNRRQPERMAQLRRAVDEVNRRRIKRDGKLLEFVVVEPETG